VKGDVGTIGQNHIQPNVTQQITNETLCCTIDELLCHYAPFHPTDKSVDDALVYLKDKQLLQDGEWQDLHDQKDVRADSDPSDKCNFQYRDCGNTPISVEIAGCTFRIDACFLPVSPRPLSEIMASQVAVAVAADLKKSRKDFYDVSTQILKS